MTDLSERRRELRRRVEKRSRAYNFLQRVASESLTLNLSAIIAKAERILATKKA